MHNTIYWVARGALICQYKQTIVLFWVVTMECDVDVQRLVERLSPLDQKSLKGQLSERDRAQIERIEREIAELSLDPSIRWGRHNFLRFAMQRKYGISSMRGNDGH
uniref:Uncharacterized protein n=1 Tax=Escherichia coli TaxID=562 RepID=A0A3L0VY39_ECOLX